VATRQHSRTEYKSSILKYLREFSHFRITPIECTNYFNARLIYLSLWHPANFCRLGPWTKTPHRSLIPSFWFSNTNNCGFYSGPPRSRITKFLNKIN
jgi:hypothetical protein